MSNGFLPTNTGIGAIPPELFAQQQQLNRQQQMAQMLLQQGMNQPQGQMVSGRFVAPSFFQYAAPLAQLYAGQSLAEKGDKAQADLAKALRQQYADEMQNYLKLQRGQEATPEKYTEMAGPFGEGVGQNNTNIPMPAAFKPAQAAVPADPYAANLYGSTAYNPVLKQVATKKLLDGPQWKEITQVNKQTGDTEIYRYDANSSNPRNTLQFLGVSKSALSPSDIIKFRDEGIPIPQQYLGGQTTGQPTIAPQGQPMGQPTGQPQVSPTVTPTVGGAAPTQQATQTKTQPFTLERFGFDPFKGPDLPTDLPAKDARAFNVKVKEPLTGDAAKTVSGATNYIDSLTRYRDYMNTLSPQDLLNPQVRAELETKHKQVLLTGKEANNLGVLNGGDERILNAVMPNYSDILITKNTLNKVIDDQMQFGSGAIVAQYRTAEKAVPERLRKYVEIEPKQQTADKQKDGGGNLQTKLRALNIPYQPRIYEYRVNPDGSVDRKRKTQ
jgi:hypothetical protein